VPGTPSALAARTLVSVKKVREGDIDGALQNFVDAIDGENAWRRLPAAAKQQLRDNIFTFLGQVHEARKPYSRDDMALIKTPTLLIGGADTTGSLATIWRVMSEHIVGAKTAVIPDGKHWMFENNPLAFCRAVMAFLAN
jgi:pimeloyl-ACP methyl ester carboxylesterase